MSESSSKQDTSLVHTPTDIGPESVAASPVEKGAS